jgi:hypothetical protein
MPDNIGRHDLDRIHERLDQSHETLASVRVAVARIETWIQGRPNFPPRPCPDFVSHVEEHKKAEEENRKTWKDIAMGLIGPTLAAAGGSLAMWLGLTHK